MKIHDLLQEDYCPYISIEIAPTELVPDTLNESQWRQSNFNDIYYRVDPENPSISLQRHVHIAHKKHITNSNLQVSWNQDGTRHDVHKFNSSFTGVEKAKDLARQVLNLPSDSIFEQKSTTNTVAGLLLELLSDEPALPSSTITLIFRHA